MPGQAGCFQVDMDLIGADLKSFMLHEDSTGFTVVWRKPSHMQYMSVGGGSCPDTLIRRVYTCQDNRVRMTSEQRGKVHHRCTLPEREEWSQTCSKEHPTRGS